MSTAPASNLHQYPRLAKLTDLFILTYFSERGLDTDKLEVEGNRSSYILDPDVSYTALVTSQIGLGLTKQFTIPNIKAGIDLNMASYRVEYKLLPPSLVVGLIVSMSASILVIGASLILFLLSQTW